MATREFELVIAAPPDAIVEDFYAEALAAWNPELLEEGSEIIEDDLPFAWKAKTPKFEISLSMEAMGEATSLTVKVEAGLLSVGGCVKQQQERFKRLRIRAEERAG